MTRCVPVPGHAAVAHLSARPLTPVLGMLPTQDMQLLRCAELDSRLLVNVLGNLQPADLLQSVEGRLQAITTALPCQGVLGRHSSVGACRRGATEHARGLPTGRAPKSRALPGDETRQATPFRHHRDQRCHLRDHRAGRRRHRTSGTSYGRCSGHHDCPRSWRHPSPPPADAQPLPRSGQQRLSAGAAHHRVGHIPAVNSNIISKKIDPYTF